MPLFICTTAVPFNEISFICQLTVLANATKLKVVMLSGTHDSLECDGVVQ